MNLNPHTREDPNHNQLILKLVLFSLGIHVSLFLFFAHPNKQIKLKPKFISVELAQAPVKLKGMTSTRQSPIKTKVLQKRDVFPKSPAPQNDESEEEVESLGNWEAAEMPLLKDLPATKVTAEAGLQKRSSNQPQDSKKEALTPGQPNPEKKAVTSNSATVIEGDAKGRELIYQPFTPPLDIRQDVTITLQFSVTAEGRVTNIFALVKGDQALEQIAIKLLSQYRFESARSGTPEQTGTIHFTLTRHP
ncbi:MAG: hypothetical protein QNL04_07935 [SAR324 cluster bacterium]|nr:hypothetical protein [SAR324 cluster bacterium]